MKPESEPIGRPALPESFKHEQPHRKLAKSSTRYAHFPILEAMRNFDGMSKEEFDGFQVLEALSEE